MQTITIEQVLNIVETNFKEGMENETGREQILSTGAFHAVDMVREALKEAGLIN